MLLLCDALLTCHYDRPALLADRLAAFCKTANLPAMARIDKTYAVSLMNRAAPDLLLIYLMAEIGLTDVEIAEIRGRTVCTIRRCREHIANILARNAWVEINDSGSPFAAAADKLESSHEGML